MLSVIIITKNEEERIKTCLESVKWADEIIIADNGSDDLTLDIAKKYTDKIFTFKDFDFATLRNKAFEKSCGDWVLYVDADERVLDSLRKEIEVMISFSDFSAYAISRINIIFGQDVKYGPFWPDWVIRLFKREDFDSWVGKLHEYAKFKGKLGYSENSLLHLTHRGVDQFMSKVMDWSKIEAKLRIDDNHPKMTKWRFLRILLTETFSQGIRRRGFFSGTIGMIDSMLQVISMFMTYVRVWEMQQKEPLKETYDKIDEKLLEDDFKYQ